MTGLYIRLHRWRGFALTNAEPDLFSYVFSFGFVTVYVCKRCLLEAYRKVRATARAAVSIAERDRLDKGDQ